ncbi:MAG: type II toxin-antitoxin system RelE/ParE family toxin [DPANN group archaeon]|nr:type II toxin-antitoxin system RelE/ParE family toxin [DPANN group archaeon]
MTQPEKFLDKHDKHTASRIINKIEGALGENPVPHNATTITGEHGVFRVRIGNYRALYRIDYSSKKIVVMKLDKRSRVYD